MRYKVTFEDNKNEYYITELNTCKRKILNSLYDLLMFAHFIDWKRLVSIEIIK